MTVKERIQEYLNYKGVSPTSAERELGWGNGAFTKAKSITVDRAKGTSSLLSGLVRRMVTSWHRKYDFE